ncbi:hypothetical protein [Meiothermus sp.]|uniref:hypothetical protein n=1 Tax=Meiothermus sp. TaxID=1955249 RepID=UPI00260B3927|nr:hypothetical protein [Meiothermus sp.]
MKYRLLLLSYTFLASLAGHALVGLVFALLGSQSFENVIYGNLDTILLVSTVIALTLTLTSQGLNPTVFFPAWRRNVFSLLVGIFAGLVLAVYFREEFGLARIPTYLAAMVATTLLALVASKVLLGLIRERDIAI